MNTNYVRFQDKVVMNIIKHIDEKIEVNDNKKKYINYLKDRTDLKESKIKRILAIGTKRRLTLNDLSQIAKALDIPIQELFKDI